MNTGELKRRLTRAQDETTLQTYAAGEIIMEQGDTSDNFYILVEGDVEVLGNNGEQVDILHAGSYFGEMGLVKGDRRSATVRTLTNVQVIIFDRNMFGAWMEKSPFSQTSILQTVEKRYQELQDHNS